MATQPQTATPLETDIKAYFENLDAGRDNRSNPEYFNDARMRAENRLRSAVGIPTVARNRHY